MSLYQYGALYTYNKSFSTLNTGDKIEEEVVPNVSLTAVFKNRIS